MDIGEHTRSGDIQLVLLMDKREMVMDGRIVLVVLMAV